MIDLERLETMIRLERQQKDTRSRRIIKYTKRDFMAMELIKGFFLGSVAYFLLLALLALFFSDVILGNMTNIDIRQLVALLIMAYIATVALYMLITFMINLVRYNRAGRHEKRYEADIRKLRKQYIRDSKRFKNTRG